MLRVLGVLVLIALYISFIIDVIRTPRAEVRSLPKALWLVIVILLPIVGGLLWWFFGRSPRTGGGRWRRRAPMAPDDDPRFLKQLDADVWSERMRRKREQDGTAE